MASYDFLQAPLVHPANARAGEVASDEETIVGNFVSKVSSSLRVYVVVKDLANREHEVAKPFGIRYSHQLFGNGEKIFGYKNLVLLLNVLSNSFHMYLEIHYTSNITEGPSSSGAVPDDIPELIMREWFPHLILDELEFFRLKMAEDCTKMYGQPILTFPYVDNEDITQIQIRKCQVEEEGFKAMHKRFQGLLVFYIETASRIDMNDKNWEFFYLYKDIKLLGDVMGHIPIGYCTVYRFHAYKRARISQFFIMPNFQRRGYGTRFLGGIYKHYVENPAVRFITVESPAPAFTTLRDIVELRVICNEPLLAGDVIAANGYSNNIATLLQVKYKMSDHQANRLYLILLHHYIGDNDREQFNLFYRKKIRDRHSALGRQPTDESRARRLNANLQAVNNLQQDNHQIYLLRNAYRRHMRSIENQLRVLNQLLGEVQNEVQN